MMGKKGITADETSLQTHTQSNVYVILNVSRLTDSGVFPRTCKSLWL